MDYKKVQERMQRIKDTQFAKHRAHIHNRGDIVIVDWKRDNTNAYAVQYTFYKNHVFITGDLGDAIFNCTWQTWTTEKPYKNAPVGCGRPNKFKPISLEYLEEKLGAFRESDVYEFSSVEAKEEIKHYREYVSKDYKDDFKDLLKETENYRFCDEWRNYIISNYDMVEGMFSDSEVIADIMDAGKTFGCRYLSWVAGIQMIEQAIADGTAIYDPIRVESNHRTAVSLIADVGNGTISVEAIDPCEKGLHTEVFVSVQDKDGSNPQDLAYIGQTYERNEDKNSDADFVAKDSMTVRVWTEAENEDYTKEYVVERYHESEDDAEAEK